MPRTFGQKLAEERRGAVLVALSESAAYRANERLLHDFLEDLGLPCSRDQVRTDLGWLRDQGLIKLEEVAGIMIAEITLGGMDVGKGRIRVAGVARPDPS